MKPAKAVAAASVPAASDPEKPRRLSLSQILEMLLSRGSGDRSTVTLARNAKGDTQLEVTVRTGEQGDAATVEEAEAKAREVYDRLREAYPLAHGHENASIELTRNAKGETQVSVEIKTADGGVATLEEASRKVEDVYDTMRGRYPMADGRSAAPGSVNPSPRRTTKGSR